MSFALEREVEIGDRLTLTPSASVGWGSSAYNEYTFGPDGGAWNDARVGLDASCELLDGVSLTATVAYSWLLDGDLEDAAEESYFDTDIVYGGAALAIDF